MCDQVCVTVCVCVFSKSIEAMFYWYFLALIYIVDWFYVFAPLLHIFYKCLQPVGKSRNIERLH